MGKAAQPALQAQAPAVEQTARAEMLKDRVRLAIRAQAPLLHLSMALQFTVETLVAIPARLVMATLLVAVRAQMQTDKMRQAILKRALVGLAYK